MQVVGGYSSNNGACIAKESLALASECLAVNKHKTMSCNQMKDKERDLQPEVKEMMANTEAAAARGQAGASLRGVN
jgi:hypothetical protein